MKKYTVFLSILILLLAGCARQEGELSRYAPPDSQQLVVYTSRTEAVYQPIVREFEERTGIWVEVVSGGSNELLQRIEKEQDAPCADVMFGGGVESIAAHADCFTPYRCADRSRIDPAFCGSDDLWTPFSALPVVLIYNTKLVDPGTVTGWQDLTRPEFRGKIAFADPEKSGSAFTELTTWLFVNGENSAPLLADALERTLLSSSGQVVPSVSEGTFLVGITLEESALQAIENGESIAVVYPEEGTSCVPDATAVVRNAPHEENARLFVDFTVTLDVQQLLGDRFWRRSVREDVRPDEDLPPLDALALLDYDAKQIASQRDELLRYWAGCMKED